MGSRILIHNLGYPRVGALRQLKKSLEAYWSGAGTEADLHRTASDLRRTHWLQQREAGVDLVPSNDFSFYDHVLDTIAMVGAVPERFKWKGPSVDLSTYFAMARGWVSYHRSDKASESGRGDDGGAGDAYRGERLHRHVRDASLQPGSFGAAGASRGERTGA